jgi:hypothetical protein
VQQQVGDGNRLAPKCPTHRLDLHCDGFHGTSLTRALADAPNTKRPFAQMLFATEDADAT